MIAHAGGIDEIILVVGLVLLFLLFRSSKAREDEAAREGPCVYCGHPLGPETERCPECGFRARVVTSSASGAGR